MEHEKGPAGVLAARDDHCQCRGGEDAAWGADNSGRCTRCGNSKLVEGGEWRGEDWSGADACHQGMASGEKDGSCAAQERNTGFGVPASRPSQSLASNVNETGMQQEDACRIGSRGPGDGGKDEDEDEDDVPEAPDDDPALTGPLGLRNDAEADGEFLQGVMDKLAGLEGRRRGDSASGDETE